MMERQVAHLSRLVEDLVIVSRLNEGRIVLRKEVVDAAVVLGRAAEAMQPRFEERRQSLSVRRSDGFATGSGPDAAGTSSAQFAS